MQFHLRPYRESAVRAVCEHLGCKDTTPCVVLSVGTGKSFVLAQIAKDTALNWRVLAIGETINWGHRGDSPHCHAKPSEN